jgi:cobalamin biosynthesis protein CobW
MRAAGYRPAFVQARTGIPTLVVSGFLGSGKTTLVRRLLDEARERGERMAVVTNEFGALGIDRALLGAGHARTVELPGGCVCCELSNELVDTLEGLRREMAPDRIVIETSGVALPYQTQLSLWRPPVSEWVGDDMAVVLVNAEQLAEGRDLGETFAQQVSAADLLLLNQIDRVPAGELPRLEAALREIEPETPIVRTRHAQVDAALLRPPEARPARRPVSAGAHGHEAFETGEIAIEPGIEPDALVARLRALGALRAKGFVDTAEGPRLVQGVGRRIELAPASPPDPQLAGRVAVVLRRASDPVPGT